MGSGALFYSSYPLVSSSITIHPVVKVKYRASNSGHAQELTWLTAEAPQGQLRSLIFSKERPICPCWVPTGNNRQNPDSSIRPATTSSAGDIKKFGFSPHVHERPWNYTFESVSKGVCKPRDRITQSRFLQNLFIMQLKSPTCDKTQFPLEIGTADSWIIGGLEALFLQAVENLHIIYSQPWYKWFLFIHTPRFHQGKTM